MTNKQALLRAAVKIGAEKWVHIGGGEVITEQYEVDGLLMADHICNCEVTGTSSPKAKFIAAANPATVLALLDELESKDKRIAELTEFLAHVKKCLARNGEYAPLSHEELDTLLAIRADGIITKVGE